MSPDAGRSFVAILISIGPVPPVWTTMPSGVPSATIPSTITTIIEM
jgi:hypothetical protein